MCFATTRRSATNSARAARRASGVGARNSDEGCTVAITTGARSDDSGFPRDCVTLNFFPSSDCAAVAPSSTTTRGRSIAISASSHGLHAFISASFGFL
jgi:hypothetical protein